MYHNLANIAQTEFSDIVTGYRGSSGICSKYDANSSDETSLSRG